MINFGSMTKEEVILSFNEKYTRLSDGCNEALEACSELLFLDKKDVLVKEGQYSHHTYYIAKGSARAYYIKDGKEITDWFAFEHEFISSIQSYFQGIPSAVYVEVLESSILLEISREDINRLSDEYREIDRFGKFIVTETMLKLQHRITTLLFETAQQKYESLLQIRPDIELRVPLIHIASYLGITIETLSRIRNQKRRI